jgi:hypothetical protein
MSDNFTRHESKSNVTPTPKTVIVEAYGLRKCPRLVEQVRSLTHSLTHSLTVAHPIYSLHLLPHPLTQCITVAHPTHTLYLLPYSLTYFTVSH